MVWYVGIFWIALPTLCLASYLWGQWPERAASSCYLLAAVMSVATGPILSAKFHRFEGSLALIDAILLASLLLIALKADRWWPILATALQAVGTLSHIAKLINPKIYGLGYQMMEESSAYPALLVLAVGIWRTRHRRPTRNA